MTQVLEGIAVDLAGPEDKKCPFPHQPRAPVNANYWHNDSQQLGNNLDRESKNGTELILRHMEETTISVAGAQTPLAATYNPHHLLPGGAAWPKTALKKWIDKKHENLVRDDIDYNVNCYQNGVDLPSSNAMRGKWTTQTPDFQRHYAFAAMDADSVRRQFHDSHKAYSDFIVKVLDKISAKLDSQLQAGIVGCDDEDCSAKEGKPYPTPMVRPRIIGTGGRVARWLYGEADKWKKPLFTSKFSLMYQNRKLTHAEAAAELSPDNFA